MSPPLAPTRPDAVTTTWDSALDGRVRFLQPRQGYRVNQDSVLLGEFSARGRAARTAIDLGAGVGVVGLVLYHLGAARRLVLVEREPELARLAEENLRAAGAPGEVIVRDLELGLPRELVHAADLVVMNPPFFSAERHQPHDPGRRVARHGALAPFLNAARAALSGSRGRATLAYPARALDELFDAARQARLTPKRLRLVHAFVDRPARLALVELRLARAKVLEIEPPLIEWAKPGVPWREITPGETTDRT